MLKLLRKELVLSMHPIAPIMLLLSAMVLIPNYPYSIVFFYITLAIFFTCLQGRENNDVVYSMTLPVAKKDIVKSRIVFCVLYQLLQMLFAIPFAILSQKINPCNQAGIDPNITYFAIGFIIYGVFNFIFFRSYYKNVNKVGFCFVGSSAVVFLMIMIEIILTHAVPFVRDYLDTKDTEYVGYKLVALAIGLVFYIVLTCLSYHDSKKRFEIQDL